MGDFFPEGVLLSAPENRLATSSFFALQKAMHEQTILEARALLCDRGSELVFDLGGTRGIMPRKEVCVPEEGGEVRDIAMITRVGKPCAFVVEAMEEGANPVAYLSRRKAQERCLSEYLDTKEDGDVLPARVVHMEPFGAFCDVGCGITALLSIDCISVSRISHPSDRFAVGQPIFCAVKGRDEVRLGRRGRLCLTHKELLGTWRQNAARFQIGQTVMGVVRSIEDYGIFIELAPNLAGLSEWRDGVCVGDGCSVYIKNIIPAKMKVKLVIIDSFRRTAFNRGIEYFIKEGNIRSFSYGE